MPRSIPTLLLLSMFVASSAYGTELYTSTLPYASGNNLGEPFLECSITNVSDQTRTVSIQGFSNGGEEGFFPTLGPVELAPGKTIDQVYGQSLIGAGNRCKFTVDRKSAVRASACLIASVTSTGAIVQTNPVCIAHAEAY